MSGDQSNDQSADSPDTVPAEPADGGLTARKPATNDAETMASLATKTLIGTRLGDYQVMRKLGRGGMADVYAARQMSLGRDVALKVLRSEFARDKDYIERFRREARAAAKLNHPHIVHVIDVGSIDSLHYIAQELIDGENLRQALERRGAISLDEAVEVLIGVSSALEAACEAGITHRDIKPENIMRSSRGVIKVADFGLARLGADAGGSQAGLTQAGLTLGTPRYMSPEQVQGQAVDVRSDLYSLGVSMYHLLAGRPPFEADDPLALAFMHLHETPKPLDRVRNLKDTDGEPDLPEWLIEVVSRLMDKHPQDRFQSPTELLDAVRNEASTSSLGGLGVGTAAATIRLQRAADLARRQRRRRQLRIAAAILLPLVCTATAALVAFRAKGKDISDILTSDTVAKAETVQEQYINAVKRNDEAGWQSVGQYYPPTENATNAGYHAKSRLQMAAMFLAAGRFEDAQDTLENLLQDPSVDRLYQALALARLCFLHEERGHAKRLAEGKRELQSLSAELKTDNPDALRLLRRTLSQAELLQLGIEEN